MPNFPQSRGSGAGCGGAGGAVCEKWGLQTGDAEQLAEGRTGSLSLSLREFDFRLLRAMEDNAGRASECPGQICTLKDHTGCKWTIREKKADRKIS